MVVANYLTIPFLLILVLVFFIVRYFYLQAAREVKRFESTTRSPILEQLQAIYKVSIQSLFYILPLYFIYYPYILYITPIFYILPLYFIYYPFYIILDLCI